MHRERGAVAPEGSVPVRSVPRDLSLKVKAKPRGSAGEQLSATGSLCQATEWVLGHHILLLLLHPPGCPMPGEQLGGQCWLILPPKSPQTAESWCSPLLPPPSAGPRG